MVLRGVCSFLKRISSGDGYEVVESEIDLSIS